MRASQISLIIVIAFILYCIFFIKYDNFSNKESFDLTEPENLDPPVYSKKCCGNLFNMTPEHNPDPNYNVKYFPSNINHLGDGDSSQGCRCLTVKEINFLASRGGNG
jgi:hypothetical protein